jgi:hypothetical protein
MVSKIERDKALAIMGEHVTAPTSVTKITFS